MHDELESQGGKKKLGWRGRNFTWGVNARPPATKNPVLDSRIEKERESFFFGKETGVVWGGFRMKNRDEKGEKENSVG